MVARCLDGQHDVQFDAQQRRTSVRSEREECVLFFVCEPEKRDMKVCLYFCAI